MTPTDLETAARHACKLLDLDPNEVIPTGRSLIGEDGWAEPELSARWHVMTKKIREAWAIQEGIRHAEQVRYLPPDHVLR